MSRGSVRLNRANPEVWRSHIIASQHLVCHQALGVHYDLKKMHIVISVQAWTLADPAYDRVAKRDDTDTDIRATWEIKSLAISL